VPIIPPSDRSRRIPRRRVLQFGAAGAALAAAGLLGRAPGVVRGQPRLPCYPFRLGVASGEPEPDGFVLWTRLMPESGGSLGTEAIPVDYEVSADDRFARVVARGTAVATADEAHSIHAEVRGLQPDRWYWYRFQAGDELSPAGRSRTLPAVSARPSRLRFAFASCQHYEQGFYAAYGAMRRDDLDLVLFLGDYIYETTSLVEAVRRHEGPEPEALEQYRARYVTYKLDPQLQAAHAAFPWLVTWDDHEVDNDYAGPHSQDGDPPERFLARRAAAYRAFWEHLPLRPWRKPAGPDARIYGRMDFGDLAAIHLLDTRQYRDDQACPEPGAYGGRNIAGCAERLDPRRTLLGAAQESWLLDGLAASSARWNVIAQQGLMAQLKRPVGGRTGYWSDAWDGYPAARSRILEQLHRRRVPNPVVIGGDIHSFWVNDLPLDFDDPRSPVVATEFVGTSISSRGIPHDLFAGYAAANPHVKFFDSRWRGYVRVELDRRRWLSDFRVVEHVRDAASPASTLARFAVEHGRPGAERA
jgi:alkaline phosphatase D